LTFEISNYNQSPKKLLIEVYTAVELLTEFIFGFTDLQEVCLK